MHIAFAPSKRSTVGLEWEILLVDAQTGELVNQAHNILENLSDEHGTSPHPWVTHELLANTLELVSDVSPTVGDAVAHLRSQLNDVRQITEPAGIGLICAGTHPFSKWYQQEITPGERYERLIHRTQWWGRNMLIWGNHVHVGVENRNKVLPLINGLLRFFPHLLALSASSPFWDGDRTGYASNRTLLFQQLPAAGLPQQFETWSEYENYMKGMLASRSIEDPTEVRCDIRPAPKWGTVEMRACDGLSTVDEVEAIGALVQCLVEHMSTQLDDGTDIDMLQPWFIRENKWRTARYGLDVDIIVDASGRERPLRDNVHAVMDMLAPTARRLSCVDELNRIEDILTLGASYERQLAVADSNGNDLTGVVRSLETELREGLTTVKNRDQVA